MKKLIYFLFIFSNLCFGQKQSYEDRKALADSFYNNNEYEHSLQIFDELLGKDSKNHYLLGRVGLCLYDLKNYQKAKEKFRLAALYCPVDENKTIAGYYANLSSCYSNLKENEKAYLYASKAYSLDDKSSQILWNAALNALNLGKYDECLNILDNAKIEKSNAFFSLYGQSYLSKGESKKAIENYENLLQNYEENNDVIKLDLLIQKKNLFNAYMRFLGENSSNSSKYEDKATQLFNDISQHKEERINMLKLLLDHKCSWYVNESLRNFLGKLFYGIFDRLSPSDKALVYLANEDYQKCYDFCKIYLRDNLNSDKQSLQSIGAIQYLSFLNLFIKDYINHNEKINKEKFNITVSLYNNLFEKEKIYSDEDLQNDEIIYSTISKTFEVFQNQFDSERLKKATTILVKIMINTPNQKMKQDFKELENKAININYQ
jgi:hypothetical protein